MNAARNSLIGEDPSVIRPLLEAYFSELSKKKCVWAVMHGWEGLPLYARHDVDLIVRRRDIKKCVIALRDAAEKTGWICYASFRFSNLSSYWLLKDNGCQSYFQIDIFTEASMRGKVYLSSEHSLARRWKNSAGIWCMPYAYAGVTVLLKELIANSKLDREDRRRCVSEAIERDGENFRSLLLESLDGDESFTAQICNICRGQHWGELERVASSVRARALRFKVRDVLGVIRYCFDSLRLIISPFLRLFIAFVGPDGCGKTTICDSLVSRFDHRPFCAIKRIHSHFGNLPRLRDVFKRGAHMFGRDVQFKPDPKPGTRGMGMAKPLGKLRSMFYVLYYGIGLFLGGLLLRKWRTFSSLIVADRYYYDYYYMRGHMNCPVWWKKMIGIMVPCPDIVFVLERPAEDIFSKKPELEIDEIERQQQTIREILRANKRACFIDASKGVEETIRAVNKRIEHWIVTRT